MTSSVGFYGECALHELPSMVQLWVSLIHSYGVHQISRVHAIFNFLIAQFGQMHFIRT